MTIPAIEGTLGGLAKVSGIWLIFWSIRRRGEFDFKLDSTAQLLRWAIVFSAFALLTKFLTFGVPRSTILIVGLAFLCWPNCAYHVSNVLRHLGVFPPKPPSQPGA
jgi:hypothetical protein